MILSFEIKTFIEEDFKNTEKQEYSNNFERGLWTIQWKNEKEGMNEGY